MILSLLPHPLFLPLTCLLYIQLLPSSCPSLFLLLLAPSLVNLSLPDALWGPRLRYSVILSLILQVSVLFFHFTALVTPLSPRNNALELYHYHPWRFSLPRLPRIRAYSTEMQLVWRNLVNLFNTGTRFHIHSVYYLSILYSFRKSCGD